MKQRILFLVRYYTLTVALFLVAKVVFMLANCFSHPFALGDLFDVLAHGFTLDLSMALYFLIVPLIITIVSIWHTGRPLTWAYRLWAVITAIAFSLAFAADTALYPHWGYKLDASCLQYLASPAAAAASVKTWLLVIGLIGLIGLMGLMGWCYWIIWKPLKPLRRRLPYGILCLLAIPLIFIGIRGGIDKSTTNVGQVYYSQNAFLNHSAVNPVFSFLSSFESTMRSDMHYEFFSAEKCDSLLVGVFDTLSIQPENMLRTQRPNVVLVMLESAGGQFTKIGGREDIMPHFNRLCDEGIYFSECYANSFRTDRATVSIWAGWPAFPTVSLQKIPAKNQSLPGIARSLCEAGYDSHYYYGGDINFTKKGSYLINAGFQRFTWMEDFTRQERKTAQWGVCDSIVFDRILQEIRGWSKDAKTPHLIGYNTLSSHEPWDVPIQVLDDKVENAFYYLDQCINHFVAELRKTPQWDNLLLIFIPDHGVVHNGLDENSQLKMHIPILWIGGAILEPRVVDVVCNQSDQAATLLGQLGLPHGKYLFSRDVFSQNYTKPFAYHTFNNGFSMVDSTRFVVYDLTSNQTVVGDAPDLVERGKAILQVSSEDINLR